MKDFSCSFEVEVSVRLRLRVLMVKSLKTYMLMVVACVLEVNEARCADIEVQRRLMRRRVGCVCRVSCTKT